MGGGRITSIGIINGFSEKSVNIGGFNDDESLLDIRNTGGFSVEFNLKLINFSPPRSKVWCGSQGSEQASG